MAEKIDTALNGISIRISWHKSLPGKLSILISSCLLATVAIMSWQSNRMFTRFLDRRLEESTIAEAKDASEKITGILDNWTTQAALAAHSLSDIAPESFETFIGNVVAASSEMVAIHIFDDGRELVFSFTNNRDDIRFEEENPDDLKSVLKIHGQDWIKKLKKSKDGQVLLKSLSQESRLPLVTFGIKFDRPNGKPLWAMLTTWQTRLIAALPAHNGTHSMIISKNGSILIAAANWSHFRSEGISESRIFHKLAKKLQSPFAFKSFESRDQVPRLGAYANISRYGLIATVSRDARPEYGAIDQIVLQTALWAWVTLFGALTVSVLLISGVTRRLKEAIAATVRIASGDFSANLKLKSHDEVGLLALAVNHMAGQIVSLLHSKVAAARQEQELATSRLVQETLFPTSGSVRSAGIMVSGRCFMASECGGDWWGHFETEDGFHYILIADATGHGAPAALVTALAYATCMTLAEIWRTSTDIPRQVSGILSFLNQLLCHAGKGRTTMTMFAMMFDPRTGDWQYASAGHNMPLLIPNNGAGQANKGIRSVESKGTPLGMDASSQYKQHAGKLVAGDKIVLYTDGLIESTNSHRRAFGKKSLIRTIERQNAKDDAEKLRDQILEHAFEFYNGQTILDDVTVVVVEISDTEQQGGLINPEVA